MSRACIYRRLECFTIKLRFLWLIICTEYIYIYVWVKFILLSVDVCKLGSMYDEKFVLKLLSQKIEIKINFLR